LSEIEVIGQEKGVIYVIYQISESITKKSRQKFWAVKMGFDFLKIGHSKIWAAKFFFGPPKSAPSLRQCSVTLDAHLRTLSPKHASTHSHT